MCFIILVNHGRRYIWNIASCVGFAGHVDLEVLNPENIFEIQEEVDEILSNILLTGGRDFSN